MTALVGPEKMWSSGRRLRHACDFGLTARSADGQARRVGGAGIALSSDDARVGRERRGSRQVGMDGVAISHLQVDVVVFSSGFASSSTEGSVSSARDGHVERRASSSFLRSR
jgi:hypothetical protein